MKIHRKDVSDKYRLVAMVLCIFLGIFGAHRFYLGKTGTAVLMVCTLGGLGIWMLADFILIAMGQFTDEQNKRVLIWMEEVTIVGDDEPAQ